MQSSTTLPSFTNADKSILISGINNFFNFAWCSSTALLNTFWILSTKSFLYSTSTGCKQYGQCLVFSSLKLDIILSNMSLFPSWINFKRYFSLSDSIGSSIFIDSNSLTSESLYVTDIWGITFLITASPFSAFCKSNNFLSKRIINSSLLFCGAKFINFLYVSSFTPVLERPFLTILSLPAQQSSPCSASFNFIW